MGVTIRHWFNTTHARKGRPTWTWLATVLIFIVIIVAFRPAEAAGRAGGGLRAAARARALCGGHPFPGSARRCFSTRCSMCHAEEPVYEGLARPPKGVMLETEAEIAPHAREIYIQAGRSHAMPPGNVTEMTAEERGLITAWFEQAASAERTE